MVNKQKHHESLQKMKKVVDNGLPFSYKNRINKSSKEFHLEGTLVEDLKGVQSIFLAGFTGSSSRAVEGYALGALWGGKFQRDSEGALILDANGFPQQAIAEGVIGAVNEVGVKVPVVVRLEGNNAELGREVLAQSGLNIIAATSLTDAAQQVVAAAGGAA